MNTSSATLDKKEQMLMQLAHYFITVENYTPIVVRGVKNEIWLENLEAPYRIIRINTNYIHNDEQFTYDLFKIKNIVRQVKKKTLSFSVNTLNILIDAGTNVNLKNIDKIDCINLDSSKDLKKSKEIIKLYPSLKQNIVDAQDSINFLINVTNDINKKTEEESKEYAKIFSKKNISITYILIFINILVYIIGVIGNLTGSFDIFGFSYLSRESLQNGEIHRLITSMFCHQDIIHLLFNMYALYILGIQTESYFGKIKYFFIYIFSGILGGLLFCVASQHAIIGANGAIFGLMGALLYFGYSYRLYLENTLKTQIIPLILINLLLGFILSNIAISIYIGGLVGGIFISMACGIESKINKQDRKNGIICFTILLIFLVFMIFL